MRADARLGGHFVLGHVDGVGTITDVRPEADFTWVTVELPARAGGRLRAEGIGGRRRHQPDRRAVGRRSVRRADRAAHRDAHDDARVARRRPSSISSATSSASTWRERRGWPGRIRWYNSHEATCPRARRPRSAANRLHLASGRRAAPPFAPIEVAIAAIREGKMVVVVDDEDRENEGDLTIAAERVTPDTINFMVTHGRGQVCLAMTAGAARRARDSARSAGELVAARDGRLRVD